MAGLLRGSLLGLAVLVAGCGIFGDDEERLEGERIPVRQAVSGALVQPAAPAAIMPEAETDEN